MASRSSSRVGCRNWQKPEESHTALTSCDSWDARAKSSGWRPGLMINRGVVGAHRAGGVGDAGRLERPRIPGRKRLALDHGHPMVAAQLAGRHGAVAERPAQLGALRDLPEPRASRPRRRPTPGHPNPSGSPTAAPVSMVSRPMSSQSRSSSATSSQLLMCAGSSRTASASRTRDPRSCSCRRRRGRCCCTSPRSRSGSCACGRRASGSSR